VEGHDLRVVVYMKAPARGTRPIPTQIEQRLKVQGPRRDEARVQDALQVQNRRNYKVVLDVIEEGLSQYQAQSLVAFAVGVWGVSVVVRWGHMGVDDGLGSVGDGSNLGLGGREQS
jgi:hypothetical protein